MQRLNVTLNVNVSASAGATVCVDTYWSSIAYWFVGPMSRHAASVPSQFWSGCLPVLAATAL